MKTIALISGGKDSILAILMAYRYGHQPSVLVNVSPILDNDRETHDIDSYMFQTVGYEAVESIAVCMGLPLRRGMVKAGQAKDQSLHYNDLPPDDDEVEELYRLLKKVKEEFPEVEGVTSGAILSNYQRCRVECVCYRLNLISLAYLWQRPAMEILEMVDTLNINAVLIKAASMGLDPSKVLGSNLLSQRQLLLKLSKECGLHAGGEGGEFETIVLDCPLFTHQYLSIKAKKNVIIDDNPYSPSGHCILEVEILEKSLARRESDSALLEQLSKGEILFPSDRMNGLPRAEDFLSLLSDSSTPMAQAEILNPVDFSLVTDCIQDSLHALTITREHSADTHTAKTFAAEMLQELLTTTRGSGWAVCYITFFVPDERCASIFREAYESVISLTYPPAFCMVISSLCKSFRLESICASKPSQLSILQCQSRTNWSCATRGPYAVGAKLSIGDEASHSAQRIILSPTRGIYPPTGTLATIDVMSELRDIQQWPPEIEPILRSNMDRFYNLASQFAFSFASCLSFSNFFQFSVADVRRVIIFLTDKIDVPLVPYLWKWCAQEDGSNASLNILIVDCIPGGGLTQLIFDSNMKLSA